LPSAPTTFRTEPGAAVTATTKRAFAYLRVSSDGQVRTDYSEDGLSIDAQREGSQDKALSLDAQIVGEFSDPGRSAYVDLHKRTGFLAMLDELKRRNARAATRVDYVIVWSLSRWARNTVDHWQTRKVVNEAGARLISITEPMAGEDGAAAFFYESMIATQNQFQSMKTGEDVKRGLKRKASVGGTYGWAHLGYLNDVDRLPDGRQIATVVPDPDRHHFLTLAFELYSTGQYSLSQLASELYRAGLRSRPRSGRAPQKVDTSALQRILRDRYYLGLIVYKRGTPDEQVFEGRHEPLIDQKTFDIVQARLDEKRVAGERPQKRQHYLRGSLFCGECGRRLVYGLSRSCTGKRYAYYFCVGRVKGTNCTMRTSINPKLIEQAIQRYYVERPVQLSREQARRRTKAIEALVAISQQAVVQVKEAKSRLISVLEAKQDGLVDMRFNEKSISAAVFKRKQAVLEDELAAAHESLAETETALQLDGEDLRIALELAEDAAALYKAGNERTKRGYNQAFFKKLYVMPEWDETQGQMVVRITGAELTEPYAVLLEDELAEGVMAEVEAITAQAAKRAPESRSGSPKPFVLDASSYFDVMAERAGFEPAMEFDPHTRLAGECLQPLGHLSLRSGSQFRACGPTDAPTPSSYGTSTPSATTPPCSSLAPHLSSTRPYFQNASAAAQQTANMPTITSPALLTSKTST
jgi:site-specific DNA recombinase